MKKKNIKLERFNETKKAGIYGIKALLDEDGGNSSGDDPMIKMDPKIKKKLLVDQKKREREQLQRKFAAGVDFLDDGELKFGVRKEQSFWTPLIDFITSFEDTFKPFVKDVNLIKA